MKREIPFEGLYLKAVIEHITAEISNIKERLMVLEYHLNDLCQYYEQLKTKYDKESW